MIENYVKLERVAQQVLLGAEASPREILHLVSDLMSELNFTLARKLLEFALTKFQNLDHRLAKVLARKLSLCTAKDSELPEIMRLDAALNILSSVEDLSTTENQESLGLAGMIMKSKWERSGQRQYLRRALAYYDRCAEDVQVGDGYTATNSAFLLDQLACFEDENEPSGMGSAIANGHRDRAQYLRKRVLEYLLPRLKKDWQGSDFFRLANVAEAFFGLRDYEKATLYLRGLKNLSRYSSYLDYKEVARALKEVVRMQGVSFDKPLEYLSDESRIARECLEDIFPGVPFNDLDEKFGLALSGGGFRASLFHIGVLSWLAETDQLRRVEVLSCVSGGSIIGAHYYLEVRKLLQEKTDNEVVRQDYIDLVDRLTSDFLKFVQTNVRTRLFANPMVEAKVLLTNYTHTQYLGELLDAELYSRVLGDNRDVCWFNALQIMPKGEPENFVPHRDNWRRHAKVPALVINATTLNTAHLWQFTTSYMGEPAARLDPRVDHRERLRRFYYSEAPRGFQQMQLGRAVAASAAVPGVFEPVLFDDLYPNQKIRLVDGGVYDNQGVEGLLIEDCDVLFVSDASGPVGAENSPAGGRVGPAMRSNNISMSLIRDRQYQSLQLLATGGSLRRTHWVYLEQNLGNIGALDWLGSQNVTADNTSTLTSYEVPRRIQQKIAAIRTDLDTFSEAEAYTLMTTGYRMAQGTTPGDQMIQWNFLEVESIIMNKPGFERAHAELLKLLDAGSETFFKTWRLIPGLRGVTKFVGALALGALLYAGYVLPDWGHFELSLNIRTIAVIAGVFVAFLFFLTGLRKYFKFDGTLSEMAFSIGIGAFGWVLALVQIKVLDRVFKKLGSMKRLRGLTRMA